MATQYLFVCSCGRKTPIETRLAGQAWTCVCGVTHTLPSMLEISRLEPHAAPASEPATALWTLRQRLVFVGAVLLVAALVMAGVIGWNWPPAPTPLTPERIRAHIDSLTVLRTLQVWGDLLHGLEGRPRAELRAYREAALWAQRWLYVAGAIGLAGMATMAGALLATDARPQRAVETD